MARSSLAALPLLLVGAAMTASAVYQDNYFFLQQDLYPGSTMTLHLAAAASSSSTGGAAALPRVRVDATIPFTSTKIPEILSRLSVPAGSPTAAAIRSTLAECEAPPLAGVAAQRCATSLESMADLAAACLGTRDVRSATMSRLSRDGGAAPPRQQPYVVESVRPHPVAGGDLVACHRMPYPYAVFSCHTTTAALYAVTLAGAEDGTKAEAMTACHKDASPGIFWPTYKKLGVAPEPCRCATSCPRTACSGCASKLNWLRVSRSENHASTCREQVLKRRGQERNKWLAWRDKYLIATKCP